MNLMEECFYQFDLKMNLLKKMPELKGKIEAQTSIENRRRICSSVEALMLEGLHPNFPISSLCFMKQTLRALHIVAARIMSHIVEGSTVPDLPQGWDVEKIIGTREPVRRLREAVSTQQPEPMLRALLALYAKMRSNFDKLPIPMAAEEDWNTALQQLYSRVKLILDENVKGKQLAMAYVDILGFRQLTIDMVAAGKFMNVDDAREAWWNIVNSAIEQVMGKEAVYCPVGGDGWLLYVASPRRCLELIDSLIIELRKDDWELPCIGVGFGSAKPTGAGAYDVEAILTYLASDHKVFRGFGKVLVTESVYRNVVDEDKGFAVHFREVDKIKVPRPGADEVLIYDYDWGGEDV
jgi:hypothetical protein